MIRAFRLVAVISIMLSCLFVQAQKNTDPCIQQVRNMYKKLESISTPPALEGKIFYLNYTVRTVTKDSVADGRIESKVEMWLSKKQLQMKSREMEIYQDENDVFAILPQKKMILRSDAVSIKDQESRQKRMSMLQDTLFTLSKVAACTMLKSTVGDADKVVVLEVNEKGKQLLNISRVTFYINSSKNEFKKVKIEYDWKKALPGSMTDLVYTEYVINQYSFNYTKKKLEKNVERLFMRSKNELLPLYASYKLIDNRIKKNPIK